MMVDDIAAYHDKPHRTPREANFIQAARPGARGGHESILCTLLATLERRYGPEPREPEEMPPGARSWSG